MITTRQLQRPYSHDGGSAYVASLAPTPNPDDLIYFLEDGEPIGSPSSSHQEIRDHGSGRCSVWAQDFYFSASDNSDCNVNARSYQVLILSGPQVKEGAITFLERYDEAILRVIAGSTAHNNRFVPNFFTYSNSLIDYLKRNDLEIPKSILEIGSGRQPYTAVRFLLEGCETYLANDLFDVQDTFSPSFVAALTTACGAIDAHLVQNVDTVFRRDGEAYRAKGLEARGNQPFDALTVSGPLDFIHSTSVLEHVQEPRRIAKRMAEILPSGGYMFHSIDFRDHRNFQKPLEFLTLSAQDYAPIATENRWRPSEWIALLEDSGFDIVDRYDKAMTAESIEAGHGVAEATFRFYRKGETIAPSVTEEQRKSFAERFRDMDLVDLSIETTQVLCRKK